MDRRDFLKATLVLAAGAPVTALAAQLPGAPPSYFRAQFYRNADPPPLDRPWPLDIREGYANNELGVDGSRIAVWLDDQIVRGAVAVSPETGHVLKYRFYAEGVARQKDLPLTRRCSTWTTVLQPRPCECPPHMHRVNDRYCIPYEIRRGRLELKEI